MSYEIKDYDFVNSGSIRGRFTLSLGPMEIRSFTYFKNDNGSEWVSGPQRQYEIDGERKYYSYVYFSDKARWSQFQAWALDEIKKAAGTSTKMDYEEDSLPF